MSVPSNSCLRHTPKLDLDCPACMVWAHRHYTFAEWQADVGELMAAPGGLAAWAQSQQQGQVASDLMGVSREIPSRWWEGGERIRPSFWKRLRSAWWAAVDDWKRYR